MLNYFFGLRVYITESAVFRNDSNGGVTSLGAIEAGVVAHLIIQEYLLCLAG
jgi:hypothetical protein